MASNEIDLIKSITGAVDSAIKQSFDGYNSRAYIVNDGEFVAKFPKHDAVNYKGEAKTLGHLESIKTEINLQKVKWASDDFSRIILHGVKGTPLSEMKNLSLAEKTDIAGQLGKFLKQLHTVKIDMGGENLEQELSNYNDAYKEVGEFYKSNLTKEELARLNFLMFDYFPNHRRRLGENLVFCHADIFENNIFIDENGKVGIIDFGNTGYFDQAADFMLEGELRQLTLDSYGADETLRKKVELKFDMSLLLYSKWEIARNGKDAAIKKCIPILRAVIEKPRDDE